MKTQFAPLFRLSSTLVASLLAVGALCAPSFLFAQPPIDGTRLGLPFGDNGPDRDGPGGMVRQKVKLLKQFDRDGNRWLNASERQAAREFLRQQEANRPARGPGGRRGGFGRPPETLEPVSAGPRVELPDAQSFPDAPLYASNVLRTFFLEFESADWEKELEAFHDTDVEVPATLIVDGKRYRDVGVHFRGMSSFKMVEAGHKRSLNLSLDFVHDGQAIGGYRTLNLLNAHEDPSFLRSALYYEIARRYVPAPQANWVRLVVNGESWGVFVNVQQFNKDFARDWFGTTKGARWKVPGRPNGRGGLAYLGESTDVYKQIYEIKSKDDPKSWAALIRLCQVLNETSTNKLEEALAPLLDVDGALKFLALENVLINNDGYWIRASDYDLYQDESGRFHLIPADANETFSMPGGPGFGGGPGPGMFLAPQLLRQADRNNDQKVTRKEFLALAGSWFDQLDPRDNGRLTPEQLTSLFSDMLRPAARPEDAGPPPTDQPRGPAGPFRPAPSLVQNFFSVLDADKSGFLTRREVAEVFGRWFDEWDGGHTGVLNEEMIRDGLNKALPPPEFDRARNSGGRRGPGGPGFPRVKGVELDPLTGLTDSNKPLLSKLLAVPSLRRRYLDCVSEIARDWLDWKRLGPIATRYQALLAEEVRRDTRKLSSFEAFQKSLTGETPAEAPRRPGQAISLKSFADQRRAYLQNHPEVKKTTQGR